MVLVFLVLQMRQQTMFCLQDEESDRDEEDWFRPRLEILMNLPTSGKGDQVGRVLYIYKILYCNIRLCLCIEETLVGSIGPWNKLVEFVFENTND